MTLTIRQSSGDQFTVEIAKDAKVSDLKAACQEKINIAAEAQRLIFKGKFEKDQFLTRISMIFKVMGFDRYVFLF